MNPNLHGRKADEDISITRLANEKRDFTVNALRHGFDVELRLWEFDALRIPLRRDVACNKLQPASSFPSALARRAGRRGVPARVEAAALTKSCHD